MALHAGAEQFGQEHGDDHGGRVDHRSAHLKGGIQYHLQARAGLGFLVIEPQAPQDILDADDRILDQHSQRHGKTAQRHGI